MSRRIRLLAQDLAPLGAGGPRPAAATARPLPENPVTEDKRVLGKILLWDEHVHRGDLAGLQDGDGDGLPDGGYGFCRSAFDPDPTDTFLLDPEIPSPGTGSFYLRTAIDGQGDERGSGTISAGLPRDLPGCF